MMEDFFKELIEWIAEKAGLVVGDDFYLGPPLEGENTPNPFAFAMERGGEAGSRILDSTPDKPSLQILTKGKDYMRVRSLAWQIHEAIHDQVNVELESGARITVRARQDPGYIGFDDAKKHMFSENFEIIKI